MTPPVKRDRVLRMAAFSSVTATDVRHLFASPRRASQYLHKIHTQGWLTRIGGDGTKECPYRYTTRADVAVRDVEFDATGLGWMVAA